MAFTVESGAIVGVDGVPVRVEVDLLNRLPSVVIVGLPGGAVRESQERVRSAIQDSGLEFPRKRVVVNLAPADLRKAGTGFDLPIALGVLAAAGEVAREGFDGTVFVGELSLDGRLRSVRGALPLALMARDRGLRRIVLPEANAAEAAPVGGVEVLAARTLGEVCDWLDGRADLHPPPEARPPRQRAVPDLSEVRGQLRARRALEIAAAGGHNLLMMGPPGAGKTMLAARMPGLLPDLSFEEAVDITRVHSVAGLLEPGSGLVTRRPFRAPHHSISAAGMVGTAHLLPGEVSLAHHGVLFLDELPEFRRDVLELLRAPLEDRVVRLVRARGSVVFPADTALVAAANPCACGYLGHPRRACTCSPGALQRYRARLSGPLLDRVDLHVWVQPVDAADLASRRPGESSAAVRERVQAARAAQRRRYGPDGPRSNAALSGDAIREAADPTDEAVSLLRDAVDRHALSARTWARMLKVARTIADLDGAARVAVEHVLEATSFRLPGDLRGDAGEPAAAEAACR